MGKRILILLRAQIAGEWFGQHGAKLPVAPILFHATLSALLCGIARPELSPFAYGIYALSIPLALTSLPLLGELGPLLRRDAAAEWIGAQPVSRFELRAARVLTIAILLGGLSLGSLLPAAVLAPMGWGGSAALVLLGLCQALVLAALLLAIQALFGQRAEGVLVLIQTLVFCVVIVGAVVGLRYLPQLRALTAPDMRLALYPPAWFASWFALPADGVASAFAWTAAIMTAVSLLTLFLAPFPGDRRARAVHSPLAILLAPLRKLATRFWVHPKERAVFNFVYDALPQEREFVIRTYPLVAVPLAFLLIGASGHDVKGEGLLALLLFTPAMYLPALLVFVPTTATPEARWILDSAPLDPQVEGRAAQKAIAVRLLVPLCLGLFAVVWAQAGIMFALRIAPFALLATMVALRQSWDQCVGAAPLSTGPQDVGTVFGGGWTSQMAVLGFGMTLISILVWRNVNSPYVGLAALAAFVAWEVLSRSRAARAASRLTVG